MFIIVLQIPRCGFVFGGEARYSILVEQDMILSKGKFPAIFIQQS